MKNLERLIWIGVVLVILSFAFWEQLALNRSSDEVANRLEQTFVEAQCGIAAGGALSSDEVSITCGLDDAGVAGTVNLSAASVKNLSCRCGPPHELELWAHVTSRQVSNARSLNKR